MRSVAQQAVVVGAGPNGLTAAARLATQGWKVTVFEAAATIGGGSRTKPFTDTAVRDVCAAIHPFGAASIAFEELDLAANGVRWLHPPIALAHPFDTGEAAVLHRDLDATVVALGADGPRWDRIVGRVVADWDRVRALIFNPLLRAGLHTPVQIARFGSVGALPATSLCRRFSGREAAALLGGLAAHSGTSLRQPTTAGVGLALAAAAHVAGMPGAHTGSQSIVDALAAIVVRHGGDIVCDSTVRSLAELPDAAATLLDVTPGQFAALAGRARPRWKHGVGAHKIDLLLSAPMPWRDPVCHRAGTVHLGGEFAAFAASERSTIGGSLPDLPFVIVTQPSVFDDSRAPAGQHVLWAYRHVPNGSSTAAGFGIEAQFDRFASGWRDLVVQRIDTSAMQFAAYNDSYVGGDITGGALTPWQTVARPRLALDPYRTRVPGVWLCSQSTPPGPGVHGMCGWNAAGSVLSATARRSP